MQLNRIPGVTPFEVAVSKAKGAQIYGAVDVPDFADKVEWDNPLGG